MYHRRLKSLTHEIYGEREKKRERKRESENREKKTLSTTFRTLARDTNEDTEERSDPPRAILSSICQVENDATQTSEKPLTRGTVDTSKGLRLGQQVVL